MLINKFATLPLKKKLFYSYTVPTIIVFALIFVTLSSGYYKSNIKSIINQQEKAFLQCREIIDEQISTLYTFSGLIENNVTITETISNGSLDIRQPIGEQYRSFWNIEQALFKITSLTPKYRVGLYIPDELVYSSHNIFFFSDKSLRNLNDYDNIKEALGQNRKYCTTIDEVVKYQTSTDYVPYIALLSSYTINKDENKQTIVSKVELPKSEMERILSSYQVVKGSSIYLFDNNQSIKASYAQNDAVLNTLLKDFREYIFSSSNKNNQIDSPRILQIPKSDKYYILSTKIDNFDWTLLSVIPEKKLKKTNDQLTLIFAIICIATISIIIAVSYSLSSYYVKRLTALNEDISNFGYRDFQKINKDIPQGTHTSEDEIDAIQNSFKKMSQQIQTLMAERYKQGQIVATAQLKALQAQINPHFLYNTLDLINWEGIRYSAGNVSEIARNLGLFYRISLNRGKAALPIEKELQHVETYVNIENFHFDGAIHLEIIVPEVISKNYACLGIILQPFVENSIVHGIAEHPDIKECSITISATLSEDNKDILFDIRDNGPGFDDERKRQILNGSIEGSKEGGYGIRNIHARLKLCYGEKYGIEFRSGPGKGTIITVRIKALTLEQLEEHLK